MKAARKMSKYVSKNENENQNLPVNVNQNKHLVSSPQPAHLAKYTDERYMEQYEELKGYVVPPRLKIVQKTSGENYKAICEVGSTILTPQMSVIAENGEPFYVVPILKFHEFCICNPYGLKGQLPFIRERTFDPNSEIAKLSQSKETWHQVCPEVTDKKKQNDPLFMLRYAEFMNFICVLKNHEYANNPFVISFHHSLFFDGKTLATLLFSKRAPYFASCFEFKTVERKNQLGDWKGLQISNPSQESGIDSWTSDEEMKLYSAFFDNFIGLKKENKIRPEYQDEDEEAPVANSGGKF